MRSLLSLRKNFRFFRDFRVRKKKKTLRLCVFALVKEKKKEAEYLRMKIERINKWFGRYAERLLRVRWWTLGAFVLLMVISVVGMKRMVKETSFDDYFIEDDLG